MKCDEVTSLFLAAHDGDLNDEEQQAFDAHIKSCESCEKEWKAYLLTLDEVSGMFQLAPPDEFTQRVKQAIGRRSKGRFFNEDRPMGMTFAIVSFVLIVLVMLAYLFISSGRKISLITPGTHSSGEVEPHSED